MKRFKNILCALMCTGLVFGTVNIIGFAQENGDSILETIAETLEAINEAITEPTITKETETQVEEKVSSVVVEDNQFELPEPVREGYLFVEWNTEEDGSGTAYKAGEIIEITDMSLYAIWEKIPVATSSNADPEVATASNASKATSSNAARATSSDAEYYDEDDEIPDYEIEFE